jgi:hypothetical protein
MHALRNWFPFLGRGRKLVAKRHGQRKPERGAEARKEVSGQNVSLSKMQGCSANQSATGNERSPSFDTPTAEGDRKRWATCSTSNVP